ncbi:MAG TPA: DinB family protein [Spirochaetota bacterium]|nr:DinB family protein [Spirochaetota bacterium]HPC41319.1 DinB family protein [Spirochaetota bacterium]HPL15414.1 DinB family protein [Spirochaetota bacterium]HQF09750.1 DinB family protein [Spirochaetota bacterium]HQH98899.1 DinB family protein [Spirochaetota bacterium]
MSVIPGKAEQITAQLRETTTNVFSEIDTWFDKDARIRSFRPARDEWTIDQIVEHVSLVNHYLLILIGKGARKAITRADRKKIEQELEHYELSTPLLEDIGINDSFEWKSPRHMVPTGVRPPEQVREELTSQKARLMDCLAMLKNGEGVLHKTSLSVRSIGKLDVYQYIYFLLQHMRRHIRQMEGIEREINMNRDDGFIEE